MERYEIPNQIGGADRNPISGVYESIVAPATGEDIGRFAWSDKSDVTEACDAATEAAPEWARLGMEGRKHRIQAWGEALRRESETIAYADAIDSGTPIRTMRSGIGKGIDYLDYFCGLWSQLQGETIPASATNLHYTVREPYGTVGILIPFNHPAFFAVSKTVPALLAGNTVVVKPSELTPVTAYLVAKAAAETLPPGVLNVVQGGRDVGEAIVADPRLLRLHFTGGVRTGLLVQRGAADSGIVKHVTMELGGKNPLIVFPDVNPSVAAEAAVVGMNYARNQGQSCGSTSRLFVHEDLARAVVDEVCRRVGEIRLGLPEHEDTQMGSLVTAAHQRLVLGAIDKGRRDGARLLAGGSVPSGPLAKGAYVEPTVFDRVDPDSALAQDEIFGPVLSVIEWSDRSQMLRQVNGSQYGLSAAIYTRDINQALGTAAGVEAGYVWVNGVETRWKATPFGGYKNSGTAHEHDLGEMLDYTRLKSVNVVMSSA